MKFSSYLSLMTFGASAVVAAPLFRDNAERRHVPAPVERRQDVSVLAVASVPATVAAANVAAAATAAPQISQSTAGSPFSYSTVTNTAGFAFSGSSYALSSSVSTSATTETQFPQPSSSASSNGNNNNSNSNSNNNKNNNSSSNSNYNNNNNSNNNNLNNNNEFNNNNNEFNNNEFNNEFNSGNFDISDTTVITIHEVQTVTQYVAVEVPVFVSVQNNLNYLSNLFENQFSNSFQSRFDNWNVDVINQLGFLISQQYEFLTSASNSGFSQFNDDNFNAFVGQFVNQFNVFQSFDLSDVQQLITVLQTFNIQQLSSFYGRSNSLFSQSLFDQFNINNNFNSFVSQLPQLLVAIQSESFDSNGIFNFSNLNPNSLNYLQIV